MRALFLSIIFVPLFFSAQRNIIPFKIFNYDPRICGGFQNSTGSLIFIPSDAFELEDGSVCNDKITIKYREFHSQTDMFYGGFNMLLEKNGKYQILESIGMFEIQAWCGNNRLRLKNDRVIQVRMKTRRNLENVKSYIYDTIRNTWGEYQSGVYDFSYSKNKNMSDSSSVWGSPSMATNAVDVNLEPTGEEIMKAFEVQLPEGFFKGMNIKTMGIFNYDQAIKDSLAVPMIPEFYAKQDGAKIEERIYVGYSDRNTLNYYFPTDFKERFVLIKTKGIRIFATYKDGSVATLSAGELDKTDLESFRNKVMKIILEKQPLKPKNEKELAKATGLNTN